MDGARRDASALDQVGQREALGLLRILRRRHELIFAHFRGRVDHGMER